MKADLSWIITRINGKIASVSLDYHAVSRLMARIANLPADAVGDISCTRAGTEELFRLSDSLGWEDLFLLGTPFQKSVWKQLFDLTHSPEGPLPARLCSYSDFAESMGKGPGVRAVAHAVGLNPVPVSIPCHLVIPKESIDRLHELENENGLFKWKALYIVDQRVHYGDYALGAALKRELIQIHMTR